MDVILSILGGLFRVKVFIETGQKKGGQITVQFFLGISEES